MDKNTQLPSIGDHLVSKRDYLYSHHGLYVGEGQVIHYAGFNTAWQRGKVEQVPLKTFEAGHGWVVRTHSKPAWTPEESVARARDRLGEDFYCLMANNCEHFVYWCITGDHHGKQVKRGGHLANAAVLGIGGAGAVVAVAEVGVVAGLSASGMMSGLATIGSVVGGGAVAGLGLMSAVPGAMSVLVLNNTMLKDNPGLDAIERKARHVGRLGTSVGATTATAGGITAMGVMGVAGFSGAGITSGLAAIGSTTGAGAVLSAIGVGGGAMIGGVVVLVAAPAVLAAAVGLGAYGGAKWWRRSRLKRDAGTGPAQAAP